MKIKIETAGTKWCLPAGGWDLCLVLRLTLRPHLGSLGSYRWNGSTLFVEINEIDGQKDEVLKHIREWGAPAEEIKTA